MHGLKTRATFWMRAPDQLVHSRARVSQRYALFPLEGFPLSRLPSWPDAEVRVLAAPALGAKFVQYLIDLPAGKRGEFASDGRLETFYYVMTGSGRISDRAVKAGSFGLLSPNEPFTYSSTEQTRLLILRKAYE